MDENFQSRFEKKVNECQTQDELCDYLFDTWPYLDKYHKETDEEFSTENNPFNAKIKKGCQKRDIYLDYLEDVEGLTVERKREKQKKSYIETCPNCKSVNSSHVDIKTGDLVCIECGITETLPGEELTYKEEQESTEKIVTYSYKRDNHFNEWLLQFQAQEQTNIPEEVIINLRNEFKKQKIKNLDEITHAKVRALLKKLKMNKYYEHVPYISNILNGINPPKMSGALEHKLRQMFKDIQEPFNKHCPENRKNFLSYSYVLYKFCELLEEDDYLHCFPLLKSKEKLHQQDVIWKNICKELKWEFIPTV